MKIVGGCTVAFVVAVAAGLIVVRNRSPMPELDEARTARPVVQTSRQETELQAEAFSEALRRVRAEERMSQHTAYSLKRDKRMRELYEAYLRITDELQSLAAKHKSGKIGDLELQLNLEVLKDQWAEVDHWIAQFNREVPEEYRIKMQNCPIRESR